MGLEKWIRGRLSALGTLTARTIVFCVEVVEHFLANHCPQLAAALAYYALFSIPPLLVIVVVCVGVFVDAEQVQLALAGSVSHTFPQRFAGQSVELVRRAHEFVESGTWGSLVLSFAGVAFGATRGFVQLQTALNRAWSISEPEGRHFVVDFLFKRLVSFGVVLGVVVFVGFSTLLTTLLATFEERIFEYLPRSFHGPIDAGLVTLVTIVLTTGALSLIYRFLPDAKIAWREVFPGALFAACALETLKSLVAIYLSKQELTDIYGRTGSLIALLVWLYASANVVFLGAEVARVWSGRRRGDVEVEEGAHLSRDSDQVDLAPKLRRVLLPDS